MDNELARYYLDAKRDTDHSYWNALISLNSILITVFTAFSFFTEFKFITSIIVILSIWACWLMITNFRTSQKVYDKLANRNFPEVPENTTEEQQKQILKDLENFKEKYFNPDEAIKLRLKLNRNEKILIRLFYAQISVIIIFLIIIIIKG